MAAQAAAQPPQLEKVENLMAFLAANGFEVVRDDWHARGAYVLLLVRPVAPSLGPCGFCGHAEALHDKGGACLAFDCACEVFTPPLEGGAQ